MSWQEREHYQDAGGPGGILGAMGRIFGWSVPFGTWFGIPVRIHGTLIILAAWHILLSPLFAESPYLFALKIAAVATTILFGVVLLHEFGHCVAARMVGGSAQDILLWPLGGLARVDTPQRPLPEFIASAGGPLVNVLICAATGVGLWMLTNDLKAIPLNPLNAYASFSVVAAGGAAFYLWWVFLISYVLLLFNMLPIYPLDGAQMSEAVLWHFLGRYRAAVLTSVAGMAGSILLACVALYGGMLFLAVFGVLFFFQSYYRRKSLVELGPGGWQEAMDYTESLKVEQQTTHKRHRLSKRVLRQARKLAMAEQAEQERIDQILAKVSAHGIQSLTWLERRALRKATELLRERDVEVARGKWA